MSNSFESYDAFISYKWDQHKSNIHFLSDYLEKQNLKVWLDRDKLKESDDLSIKMKDGIDQSELFICCVTDNYCDFEDVKNKNCKSEFNYAFSTNKKILYIIFSDVKGLGEAEIIKRFNAVGFRMSGNLFYKYSQSNLDQILDAINRKKQEIKKTPLNNYLPNHTDEYVKKTDLEKKISDLFVKTNVVIITGSSGMGKTSLALNYGREMAKNNIKIVRFINSKNKDSIYDSLSKILDSFTSMRKRLTEFTVIEIIEHLIFYLKKFKVEYLFVIDNLNDFDDLKFLMENTQTNVKYLITTQIEVNEGHEFEKIDMTYFNIAETYDYMIKNLKRKDRTNENCSQLSKAIFETSYNKGIIPIYLVQLVQYLNKNKEINLRDLITNFKEENFDIMSERLEKIREENKQLWSLLKCLSLLDGSFIHFVLLKMYLNIDTSDKQTLSVLISSAKQNSLLIDDYDEENVYGVRIHELIQTGIRNKEKFLNEELIKIANIININYSESGIYPSSWQIILYHEYLINHAIKLLEHKELKDKQIIISLNRKIAKTLIFHENEFERGIKYCKNALDNETDVIETSKLNSLMGSGFKYNGDYDKAIEYFKKSLKIVLKTNNHEDPLQIVKTYDDLGSVYFLKGETDNAIDCLKKTLDIYFKVYNYDHQSIGNTFDSLGNLFHSKGEYDNAIENYKNSLEIKLKASIYDYRSIGKIYYNLGSVYDSKHEFDIAIEYFKKSLDIYFKAYNHDHPSIGETYYNLGSVYFYKGEYDNAIEYYIKSLEIKLKEHSHDHPSIGGIFNDLGLVYNSKGEYAKAIEYLEKALEIKLKVYSNDHSSIGETYNNLGLVYRSKGDWDNAIKYFKKSLEIDLKKNNHEDSSIGGTYNDLASVYYFKGEIENAIDYFKKSLDIFIKAFSPDDPSIGHIYSNLGSMYRLKGEYDNAIEYLKKSLDIFLIVYNNDHSSIGETYNNLGLVYRSKGDWDNAIKYFKMSLEIDLKKNNHEDSSIGDTYKNLGFVYRSKGEHDNAIEYLKKSLEIKLKAHNHDHPSIEGILDELGLVYNSKREYAKAIEYLKKALEIKLKVYSNDDSSIGETYNNLGLVYRSKGDWDNAIKYYKKSLEIKLKAYDHDHPSIVEIYKNIDSVYDLKPRSHICSIL